MERRGRTELEGLVLRYIDESEALKGANVGVYFEPSQQWTVRNPTRDRPSPAVEVQADKLFVPASNAKILTAAAALLEMGPDFMFTTELLCDDPSGGNLWVRGNGDPSFSQLNLMQLAASAVSAGVTGPVQVSVEEETYSRSMQGAEGIDSTWMVEDVDGHYGASPGVLNLEGNLAYVNATAFDREGSPVQLVWDVDDRGQGDERWERAARRWQREVQFSITATVGRKSGVSNLSVTYDRRRGCFNVEGELAQHSEAKIPIPVPSPMGWFVGKLSEALELAGIQVSAVSRTPFRSTDGLPPVSIVRQQSSPLRVLLHNMMHSSDNLYAECILSALGAKVGALSRQRAAEHAMDVLCRAGVGAQRRWWLLWDGSGLSRRNLLSPRVLADVLHVASREPRLSLLPDLLPRAGGQHGSPARGQGTLSGRLTQCQCVVQAKTGTMHGIASLSGYLSDGHGSPAIFSILVDSALATTPQLRAAVDGLAMLLANGILMPSTVSPMQSTRPGTITLNTHLPSPPGVANVPRLRLDRMRRRSSLLGAELPQQAAADSDVYTEEEELSDEELDDDFSDDDERREEESIVATIYHRVKALGFHRLFLTMGAVVLLCDRVPKLGLRYHRPYGSRSLALMDDDDERLRRRRRVLVR